ncbi:hypothetical protein HPB51_004382 [Rhipicephalus microplus]|uniref:Partial AB-hydrolase lipase domain-containing protein n=1 Tax=Rhipicephalus microplus TaxID=6941 RepID=A0A9J6EM04_RHIMP|nr:hypothetical protein HPB51_004382 [Rhipicephalus microplus]
MSEQACTGSLQRQLAEQEGGGGGREEMKGREVNQTHVRFATLHWGKGDAVLVFLLVGGTLPSWKTRGARALMLPKDADADRSIEELIEDRGYPVESRKILTDDGYVLGLYRIPRGRLETEETTTGSPYLECDGASRTPLLLVHGLLSSAITWVTNYADQSLGYVLADAGYDVWLGNLRGSTLSRKHMRISPDDNASFWDFTFDQMIEYDVPAMIDYVLRETGCSRLGYIGHSQGSLIMFGLLSSVPAYNEKVHARYQHSQCEIG